MLPPKGSPPDGAGLEGSETADLKPGNVLDSILVLLSENENPIPGVAVLPALDNAELKSKGFNPELSGLILSVKTGFSLVGCFGVGVTVLEGAKENGMLEADVGKEIVELVKDEVEVGLIDKLEIGLL